MRADTIARAVFNPNLKQASDAWLTYATPLGFRLMFLSIAVVLSMSAGSAAAFSRWPPVLLGIVAICILASAYLERWIFDKDSGLIDGAQRGPPVLALQRPDATERPLPKWVFRISCG